MILIAEPDQALDQADMDEVAPSGTLSVAIYKVDRTRPEHVRDLVFDVDNNEAKSAFLKRAVKGVHQLLQADWKHKTAASVAQTQNYEVRLNVSSLKEWLRIQRDLNRVVGLSDMKILSIKPREIYLTFSFRGDANRLSQALSRNGLDMDLSGDAVPDFTDQEPVYDLQKDSRAAPQSPEQGFYTPPEPAAGEEAPSDVRTF